MSGNMDRESVRRVATTGANCFATRARRSGQERFRPEFQ